MQAQRFEGGHKVKGEGVGLSPKAYQEAHPDSSQHHGFPDHLINEGPVSVHGARVTRHHILQHKGNSNTYESQMQADEDIFHLIAMFFICLVISKKIFA